jgi:hypothetical protein
MVINSAQAKHKIPISYCTANQLINVKVSFQTERLPCIGYQIGAAGKYLPKMHNSTQNTYHSNLFPRINCSCHENGFVHHLNHACRQAILRYTVFWQE